MTEEQRVVQLIDAITRHIALSDKECQTILQRLAHERHTSVHVVAGDVSGHLSMLDYRAEIVKRFLEIVAEIRTQAKKGHYGN